MRDFIKNTVLPERELQVINRICQDVKILGDRLFQIADNPPEMARTEITKFLNEKKDDSLISALNEALYRHYYMEFSPPMVTENSQDLLPLLQAANASRGGEDSGWQIINVTNGAYVVQRNGITRSASAEYLICKEGHDLSVGSHVSIKKRREDVLSQRGFYYIIGDELGDQYDDAISSRFYLNIELASVSNWVSSVSGQLNGYSIPFHFKVLRYSDAYYRVERGILYVPRHYAPVVAAILIGVKKKIGGLGSSHPVFSRKVADGIGLADNPLGGESFGMVRMEIIAEAIVQSWRCNKESNEDYFASIISNFLSSGIQLDRPWLNKGNTDYELLGFDVKEFNQNSDDKPATGYSVAVAEKIGKRLVRDAVWHNNQCTWIGWERLSSSSGVLKRCDGDFYSGTAGISLFLYHLSKSISDSQIVLETALAALRFSISAAREKKMVVGSYAGLSGILYVTHQLAQGTGLKEIFDFREEILEILESCDSISQTENDIISGRAGAIRVLTRVGRECKELQERSFKLALRYGDDLIHLAERQGMKWSWKTIHQDTQANLVGYSHGTAGIACALKDLYEISEDDKYKQAYSAALEYELSHFIPELCNWPDFRGSAEKPSCMCAWCHGAPGSGLALSEFLSRDDALMPVINDILKKSIETIQNSLENLKQAKKEEVCLCHGTAGNIEILLEINRVLPITMENAELNGMITKLMECYHETGDWPCFVPEGRQALGMMTGLAGVGYFFLRDHNRDLPSILKM